MIKYRINFIFSSLLLICINICIIDAIVDEDAKPWIYKLPKSHRTPVCKAPLYMGVVKITPITQMAPREVQDFHKYLFSSVDLQSESVRFVFANTSDLGYFNQSDNVVFGYPSSRHGPMKNLADLLYAMREYVYPKKDSPKIAKILVIITDIIAQNISGVLQEARLLRRSGVYIVITGVRNTVGDTRLLREITNNKNDVHIFPSFSDLIQNLRDILIDVCGRASSLARARRLQVHPSFGPESGGTVLTIVGHDVRNAQVGKVKIASVQCKLDWEKSEYVTVICVTGRAKGTGIALNQPLNLTVHFTNGQSTTVPYAFKYKADPVISAVNPRRTILSGGILLTVTGRNMDSVAKPLLLVHMEYRRELRQTFLSEVCNIMDSSNITCPTPKLDLPQEETFVLTTTTTSPKDGDNEPSKSAIGNPDLRFYLGLEMDGVSRYRDLSRNLPAYSDLDVYIDPKIDFFEYSPIVLRPGISYLDIKGSKLTLGLTIRDFKVKVGDAYCELVDLNYNRLSFKPPKRSPKGIEDYDGSYKVQVGVGYLTFTPGNVTYANSVMTHKVIIAVGCTLALLVILATLIVTWYLRRSKNKQPEESLDSKPQTQKLKKKDGNQKNKAKESKLKQGKSKQEPAQEKWLPRDQYKPPLPRRNPQLPKIMVNNGTGPMKSTLYKVVPPQTK